MAGPVDCDDSVTDDPVDASFFEFDQIESNDSALKRDIYQLYNALVSSEESVKTRYNNFINGLTDILTDLNKCNKN